jgi:hypothetical protein
VTSHPDEPQPTHAPEMAGTQVGDMATEWRDPDLVVLTEDDEVDQEAVEEEQAGQLAGTARPAAADEPVEGGAGANGAISEQWHDIQAMFVDDPQGSVQRAAQAADEAVSALVESLRRRQAALVPAGVPSDRGETEQLRAALRSYRIFCQRVAVLDEQLPRADAMAS